MSAADSYDRIPYRSLALPQTHPDRLASIARVFRLTPPDVASCRVLELGCASGGNLVPMACALPGSEFVGIDTSRQQVADGQAAIRALGLRNLRVEQASILDVDDSWGQFDYIICHGVFSWVDPPVQDHILRVASANLSASGVAFISYNTYPGWHMREMVRNMMRYHAAQFAEPQEQIAQARAVLSFVASASPDTGPYAQYLTSEAERASRAPDSYLFHEHLERTNLPLYFHQFIDRAGSAGLQYLSEAVLSEMLTGHFPPPVAATLERISGDLLHLEQYMDFLRNRQFRQTLLVHESQTPVRALHPDALRGLWLSSPVAVDGGEIDLRPGTTVHFSRGSQRATLTKAASKAAFAILIDAWPRAIEVDVLCDLAIETAGAHQDEPPDEARHGMLEDLFGAMMYGLADLHTVPAACTDAPGETPRALPCAAFEAQSGALVTNAYHHVHDLEPLALAILRLADGQHTRGRMAEALMRDFDAGSLELGGGETSLTDRTIVRTLIEQRLEEVLQDLTHRALLAE